MAEFLDRILYCRLPVPIANLARKPRPLNRQSAIGNRQFNFVIDMPRYLRNLIIALIVIGVLYGLDFVFQAGLINPYYSRILMLCGISITLAVSLNLINGFTGQFPQSATPASWLSVPIHRPISLSPTE